MPEVGGVGGGGGVPTREQNQVGDKSVAPVTQANAQAEAAGRPVGQPGPLGQPTGLPAAPGQQPVVLPDVLTGRDASQLFAAEQMRARGGAAALDELLGLNRQPTMTGALAAPPGNSEALRHMTPTMRRTIMRNLLDKQRGRMRRLAPLLRREGDEGRGGGGEGGGSEDESAARGGRPSSALEQPAPDEARRERARRELGSAARMLDLLDELLAMQDYAISQMGTFSQG